MLRSIATGGIAVALTLGGCASAPGATRATGDTGFNVVLRVENDQWYEMRIFIEGGIGAQTILGNVPAKGSRRFVLPRHLTQSGAELRLVADPIGSSRRVISERLDLDDGHNVEWNLRSSGGGRLLVM